ncbi:MAG: hypothetical protein R2726_07045 [Acidimicrobiales bacterium]
MRRAQAIRAEALAHRHHRAPFALRLAAVLEPARARSAPAASWPP